MTVKNTLSNRVLSIFLCIALLLTCLPLSFGSVAAATGYAVTADESTMDTWKNFFYKADGSLSTENAGGVWTDKSVFTDASAFSGYLGTHSGTADIQMTAENSLLVALSAIGSNMTVTGRSGVSTDTVFVLDVSGSMARSHLEEDLVTATNAAITTLMATGNNRVGIVLYSGSSRHPNNNNAAVVLLPLGKYTTTDRQGRYVQLDGSNIELVSGVQYATGGTPVSTSKEVTGATYIQKGLILAKDQFEAAAIPEGEVRKPVLVLMSDGEPTLASTNFTAPGQYNMGDGDSSSAAIGFVTQLSAAYAKQQITEHYGTECLFYTLGLGTSSSAVATNVLNPAQTLTGTGNTTSTIRRHWQNYNALEPTHTLSVQSYPSQSVVRIEGTLPQVYVNTYFDSDEYTTGGKTLGDALKEAFADIVAEIELQSAYHPTLIQGSADLSGYISFVDKIGQHMEVTDIKGITVGNDTLFSGADLAQHFTLNSTAFGTVTNPTDMGTKMVDAVMQRIGVPTRERARALIDLAFERGQLHYTDENDFSNYIGWCADEAGGYLGFWYEGMPADAIPAGTAFFMKSYGYLGTVNDQDTANMMYAVVQVKTDVTTGEQTVSFGVPASLIPLVDYKVTLTEDGTLTDVTAPAATEIAPIRLVYEVALNAAINPFTVTSLTTDAYRANYTGDNGDVYFYTNQYEVDHSFGYGKVNTYSYFRPSAENDRYYFQNDTLVYANEAGVAYTGTTHPKDAGVPLYRQHIIYEKNGSPTVYEGYHQLTASALEDAVAGSEPGTWVIPSGHVRMNYEGYTIDKADTTLTETLPYANRPFVDVQSEHVEDTGHTYVVGATLGNNGRIAVTPETGVKISKTLAAGSTPTDKAFAFEVKAGTAHGTYPGYRVNVAGVGVEQSVAFVNGVATVALKNGETLYIGGLDDGSAVTVDIAEVPDVDYAVESVNGTAGVESTTVTIQQNVLQSVAFVNADRGKGNLSIAKDVTHNYGDSYVIPDKTFTMTVTLAGVGVTNATFQATRTNADNTATTETVTVVNGQFTVTLKDGQQLLVKDLPAGTEATVVETGYGDGFTPSYWEDAVLGDGAVTVERDRTAGVIVRNAYATTGTVSPNVVVSGTKTLDSDEIPFSGTFTFYLQRYNRADGTWTNVSDTPQTVKYTNEFGEKTFTFGNVLKNEVYSAVGTYSYRIMEVNDNQNGVVYDTQLHSFSIHVTDTAMDGKLEISPETGVTTTRPDTVTVTAPGTAWTVEADFLNNYYNYSVAQVTVDVQKAVENLSGSDIGKNLAGFAFTLYDEAGNPLQSLKTNDRGGLRFGLSYTADEVGTYTYTLKEAKIAPETYANVGSALQFDTKTVTITVKVTLDNNVLSAVVTDNDANTANADNAITVNFQNRYVPDEATLLLDFVQKALSGRDLEAGEFAFEVYRFEEGSPYTLVAKGTNEAAQMDPATGIATARVGFDTPFTYDTVGTWFYDVMEVSSAAPGVTSDRNTYHVTVNVTDVDGQLVANYVLENAADTVVFNNTYKAAPTTYTFSASKTLSGREMLNGEFTFYLQAANAGGSVLPGTTPLVAANATAGLSSSVSFSPITYTATGTYYYVMWEQSGATGNGVKFDSTRYLITQVVTDDTATGKLVAAQPTYTVLATGAAAPALTFVNTYTARPTSADLTGDKLLSGRAVALKAEEFSFRLYASDAAGTKGALLETVKNDLNGDFAFSTKTYDAAGDYYYLVEEVGGGTTVKGVAYDPTVFHVHVTVTDNQLGQLVAEVIIDDTQGVPQEGIIFRNQYELTDTDSITLSGQKTLPERTFADGEFTFALYETDGTFATDGIAPDTVTNVDGGYTMTLNYLPEDAGKTFYYVVKEQPGSLGGVSYDSTAYKVTVTVTDDSEGNLTATATVDGGTALNALNFTNHYTAAAVPVSFGGTKDLQGDRSMMADDFTFTLYAANETFTALDPIEAVQNKADGTFTFAEVSLTTAGEHYFVIKENGNDPLPGVTYDTAEYRITVAVVDDGNGQLEIASTAIVKASAEGTVAAPAIVFTNTYKAAPVPVAFEGTKELLGNRPLAADDFTFVLYATDATFTPRDLIESVQNGADKRFAFADVSLNTAGEHYFVITENRVNELPGVTYDEAEYRITVTVEDDGNGQLEIASTAIVKVTAAGSETAEQILFTNSYQAEPVPVAFEGTKELLGNRILFGDDFSFELYTADSDFTAGDLLETVKNEEDTTFTFTPVSLLTAGEHYFLVKENRENPLPGVTYDEAEYHITVTVEDDMNGQLQIASIDTVKVTAEGSEEAEELLFTNSYATTAVELDILARKELTGRDLVAGEFAFLLQELDIETGEPLDKPALRAVNAADGTVTFEAIPYTEEGIYLYKMYEDTTVDAPRVSFDDTVYYVAVLVLDDYETAELSALYFLTDDLESEELSEEAVFTNTYIPKPADIDLTVSVDKTVENKGTNTITAEGFTFTLEGEGQSLTATTDAQGKAAFTLTYTEDDIGKTYTYTVKEVNDGKANVTYSEAVYTVAVTVALTEDNVLVADVTVNGEAAEEVVTAFVNTYDFTPPSSPQTGETNLMWLWFGILFVSGGVVLATRKRKQA